MGQSKLDLLQGTLDVMVLQTLEVLGPMHGYGIARRIEQVSGNEILLNQGTIYASLVRLQQRGWIAAKWGTSDTNRKAKFYSSQRPARSSWPRTLRTGNGSPESWGGFSPCTAKEVNSEAFPSRSVQPNSLFLPQRST
jgi:PadR family transcriptional regulator PadR